ncbi:MAG: serine/threonine-protein phosphatase [Lachnospiraceae bacterium]|nr:serine/threonine-protein phosphatase [Lachnospiraceae bacterium]
MKHDNTNGYLLCFETDVGNIKEVNEDSVIIKHALLDGKEIIMAIVCDGMGGLTKGELASATVVKEFGKWFENEMPTDMENIKNSDIAEKWVGMLKALNEKILLYGQQHGYKLGTTFTGMFIVEREGFIVHIGDSRAYYIGKKAVQLTKDHTFIAREIEKGTISSEQAKTDKRRNLLLQCVGASISIVPDVIYVTVEKGVYLLCTDGFRHEISEKEIFDGLRIEKNKTREEMSKNLKKLINTVKERDERDNISAIIISNK